MMPRYVYDLGLSWMILSRLRAYRLTSKPLTAKPKILAVSQPKTSLTNVGTKIASVLLIWLTACSALPYLGTHVTTSTLLDKILYQMNGQCTVPTFSVWMHLSA